MHKSLLLGLLCALAATSSWAHAPYLQCKLVDAQTVFCRGGFTDGSNAKNITLDVISEQEEILLASKLDAKSEITFAKPDVPFYILLDVGAGHTAIVEGESLK